MTTEYITDIDVEFCAKADHWVHAGPCPTYEYCDCVIDGPSWNGRCRRCHEASLLPAESFEDWYIGIGND